MATAGWFIVVFAVAGLVATAGVVGSAGTSDIHSANRDGSTQHVQVGGSVAGTDAVRETDIDHPATRLENATNLTQSTLHGIAVDPAGGFVVAGGGYATPEMENFQAAVMKVHANGTVAWARVFGGDGADLFKDVLVTEQGEVVAAGTFGADNQYVAGQPLLVGLNASNGTTYWENRYRHGGRGQYYSVTAGFRPSTAVAVGEVDSTAGLTDILGFSARTGSTNYVDEYRLGPGVASARDAPRRQILVSSRSGGMGIDPVAHTINWTIDHDHTATVSIFDAATATADAAIFGGYVEEEDSARRPTLLVSAPNGSTYRLEPVGPENRSGRVVALTTVPGSDIVLGSIGLRVGEMTFAYQNGSVIATDSRSVRVTDIAVLAPRRHILVTLQGRIIEKDLRPPTAVLNASQQTGEVGTTVFEFDASPSLDGHRYRWDFDSDGSVDTTTSRPTVEHTFQSPGAHQATVTVVDPTGNHASTTLTVVVHDTTAPVVNLTEPAQRLVATTGLTSLDASGSTDNHRIGTYRWDFDGDGVTDVNTTGPHTQYRFRSPGNHTIRVTAVDPSNNSATGTFHVETRPNDRPNVSVSPNTTYVGETVLRATTRDTVGGPVSATWFLPNGTTANGNAVNYRFERTGTYAFTVVVRDDYGATTRVQHNVTVEEFPHHGIGPGILIILAFYGAFILVGGLIVLGILAALYSHWAQYWRNRGT